MAKHRAVIVGAGRIGAGYNWHDDVYTHAGAYKALSDRVELVGFVEPDLERGRACGIKWGIPWTTDLPMALDVQKPDIVSVCTQPEQQAQTIGRALPFGIKAIWCEKPFVSAKAWIPIQVNYLRRGDPVHQKIAREHQGGKLIVYGKDDIHTRCHFDDLAKWWKATLEYHVENGPCRYYYTMGSTYDDLSWAFPNGGVDGGQCMKAMLGNLLDHLDKGDPLWSPPT